MTPDTIDERAGSVTPEGDPVERRIPNARVAYAIYQRLERDNKGQEFKNVRLRNLYDGHPPVSSADRIRKAQAWIPNVNYGEAKAIIDSNVSAQWQMFNSEPILANFEWQGYGDDPREYGPIADLMAETYTCTLRAWEKWDYHLLLRLSEMNKFANGPVFWRDEWDWHGEAIQEGRLLLPRRTRSLTCEVQAAGVRDEMSIQKLFKFIEAEDAAELGWNVPECHRVLAESVREKNRTDAYQEGEWADIAHRIKNKDYLTADSNEFDGIKIVHMLVEEVSCSVSHYIIADRKVTPGAEGPTPQFMFEAPDRFESMDKVLHFLLYSIGDGYYYSIASLLQQIYPTCDLSNRMLNALMTGAIMSSGIIVQAQQNFKAEDLSIVHLGAAVAVNKNLEIQQSSFSPPIDKVAFARSVMSGIQNNNVGMRKAYQENPDQKVTPTQIQYESNNEATYQMHQAAWLYAQFDAFHAETFRRLINPYYPENACGYEDHEAFMKKLEGVPEKYLDASKWKVKSVRAVGMGSLRERRQIANQVVGMSVQLDEAGRKEAIKLWFNAWMDPAQAKRFVTDIPRDQVADIQFQIAEGENADMLGGYNRTLGEMDNDRQHLKTHFQAAAGLADQFAKNPVIAGQVAPQLKMLLEHCMQHVQRMAKSNSRKEEVKQYKNILRKFASLLTKMIAVANKVEKQRQASKGKQQQLSESMQLGLAKIQADTQVEMERIKAMQTVELERARMLDASRQVKTQTSAQATTAKAASEIAREDRKAEAEILRDDAKAIAALTRPEKP